VAYKQKVKLKIKNTIKSMPKTGTAGKNKPVGAFNAGGYPVNGTAKDRNFPHDAFDRGHPSASKPTDPKQKISKTMKLRPQKTEDLAKRFGNRLKANVRADRKALAAKVEAKAKKTAMRKAVVKGVAKDVIKAAGRGSKRAARPKPKSTPRTKAPVRSAAKRKR
jgi:hypothetical protein